MMEVVNANMLVANSSNSNNSNGFFDKDGQLTGNYVWVDVKVNDFYLPDWLRLNLEAMRKKRGVRKVQSRSAVG